MGNDRVTADDKVARDASALLRRPAGGPSLTRGDGAKLWPRRDEPRAGMLDVLNRQGDPEREMIREMAVAGVLMAVPASRVPGAAGKLWQAAKPVVKSALGWAAARAAMAKAAGADWRETGREALEGAVEGAAMRVLPGNRLAGAGRAVADAAKLSLAGAAISAAKGEGASSVAGDAAFTAGASLVMDSIGAVARRTPAPVRLALGALGVAAAVTGDSRDLRDAPGTWGHFIKWARDPANDGRPYTDYVGGLSDEEAAAYRDARGSERVGDDGSGTGGFMRALHEAVLERASGTRRATGGGDADEGYGQRFEGARGLLATDDVPDSLFGIPVVHSRDGWTESDISFFRKHPEAAGFYDLGDGESVDDGSPEGAPRQADEPKETDEEKFSRWSGQFETKGKREYLVNPKTKKREEYVYPTRDVRGHYDIDGYRYYEKDGKWVPHTNGNPMTVAGFNKVKAAYDKEISRRAGLVYKKYKVDSAKLADSVRGRVWDIVFATGGESLYGEGASPGFTEKFNALTKLYDRETAFTLAFIDEHPTYGATNYRRFANRNRSMLDELRNSDNAALRGYADAYFAGADPETAHGVPDLDFHRAGEVSWSEDNAGRSAGADYLNGLYEKAGTSRRAYLRKLSSPPAKKTTTPNVKEPRTKAGAKNK